MSRVSNWNVGFLPRGVDFLSSLVVFELYAISFQWLVRRFWRDLPAKFGKVNKKKDGFRRPFFARGSTTNQNSVLASAPFRPC